MDAIFSQSVILSLSKDGFAQKVRLKPFKKIGSLLFELSNLRGSRRAERDGYLNQARPAGGEGFNSSSA